jgi:hypothetical protein
METVAFEKDLALIYVSASSFPAGVMDAHNKLQNMVPFVIGRKFFGLSRPENGAIMYKAAAEVLNVNEAALLNLDQIVLKKGNYVYIDIPDFMQHLPLIAETFTKLLAHPNIDPQGYCVEWYLNAKDVKCMVRLQD